MTPATSCPRLDELAYHCAEIGPVNVKALIHQLQGIILTELANSNSIDKHPAVRVILGHMAYLAGQGLGPEQSTVDEYRKWSARYSLTNVVQK